MVARTLTQNLMTNIFFSIDCLRVFVRITRKPKMEFLVNLVYREEDISFT